MAIAMKRHKKRKGLFSDYYLEPTPADITEPTIRDPEAATALRVMRHEVDLPPPLPPVPVFAVADRRAMWMAFGASLLTSALLLAAVVRFVIGWR